MRIRKFGLAGVAFSLVMAFSGAASASPIDVNDPALAPYNLPYGDFTVWSLQFADTGTGTNSYFVASSPGQLLNDKAIVIGTGAGNTFANGTPTGSSTISGIDAPYATENGKQVTSFTTADPTASPTQGQFSQDSTGTWNALVSSLNTALNGQAPVFYFNLNENGKDDLLSGTDLLFWMRTSLVAPDGTVGPTFYLAGNPFDPNNASCVGYVNCGVRDSILLGAPDPNGIYPDTAPGSPYDPDDARWTYVHGDICVNGSTFEHYGSCVAGDPAGSKTVNQNLGANQAAFAAYNSTLASDLFNPFYSDYTLQVEWVMADQDNGYEQMFLLGSGATQILIPEPVTLSLFGAGLLGLFATRRRKKA
jgi:hypothetical protein